MVNQNKNFHIYFHDVSNNQLFITVVPAGESDDSINLYKQIYTRIMDILTHANMEIIKEKIFGSVEKQPDLLKVRRDVMQKYGVFDDAPVTYIEGQPIHGHGLSGIKIRAIRLNRPEDDMWLISENGIGYGRGWNRNGTMHLMLQNIHGLIQPDVIENNRKEQTAYLFDRINHLLKANGFSYQNVVRTWIYIKDILEWYDEFNVVRNAKYREFNLIPNSSASGSNKQIHLPASTGIEGRNPADASVVMDVLAIKNGSDSKVRIVNDTGIQQREAFLYGSAFSRSNVIYETDHKHIYLSGTAAIDEQGKSLFLNNPKEQIRKTFKIVKALINNNGADLKDICAATVYLKKPEYFSFYKEVIAEYGLIDFPAICVIADVCRDELLFELDAEAILKNKN